MLFNGGNDALKFIEEYGSIILESKRKAIERKVLKILTPKEMLRRLPIAVTQVKTGNHSQSLLNEIRQTVYPLHQSNEITKIVKNNIIKSMQIYKTDTIFINSENSRTSKSNVLRLRLTDKLDLRRGKEVLLYQILVLIIHGKT